MHYIGRTEMNDGLAWHSTHHDHFANIHRQVHSDNNYRINGTLFVRIVTVIAIDE